MVIVIIDINFYKNYTSFNIYNNLYMSVPENIFNTYKISIYK